MNPEAVAEKFRNLPGMQLISFHEVALPVFRITLRAVIAEEKPITPFDEFILRSIDEGFGTPEEIGGILGMDDPLIVDLAADLLRNDCIHHASSGKQATLALTPKGRRRLNDAIAITPTEQQVSIDFDAISWRLTPSTDWYLKPKAVKLEGLIEVPAAKKRPPEVEDLKIEDVDRIVKHSAGRLRVSGRVLALKTREARERMYRRAVALVYRGTAQDDIFIAIAINGVRDEELEQAVSTEKLYAKLGINTRQGLGDAPKDIIRALRADGLTVTPSLTEMILGARPEKTAPSPDVSIALAQQPQEETDLSPAPQDYSPASEPKKLKQASKQEVATPAIPLPDAISMISCYDHPDFLREALHSSARRLLIISPWITKAVVNRQFISNLRACLDRGVDVYIGWGIKKLSEYDDDIDPDIRRDFDRLRREYPQRFFATRLGNTHSKVLVCDSDYVITTSFNWLSFRGDPTRTARDERGTVVRVPEYIEAWFTDYQRRITDH